jgi:hypothetical protein
MHPGPILSQVCEASFWLLSNSIRTSGMDKVGDVILGEEWLVQLMQEAQHAVG